MSSTDQPVIVGGFLGMWTSKDKLSPSVVGYKLMAHGHPFCHDSFEPHPFIQNTLIHTPVQTALQQRCCHNQQVCSQFPVYTNTPTAHNCFLNTVVFHAGIIWKHITAVFVKMLECPECVTWHVIASLWLPCCLFCVWQGGKKHSGPCGGRDCSGGCQCFPEKGARVSSLL